MSKIFLFIIAFASIIFAENPEELFNSANKSYQEKNYAKSVDLYEELVNNGYEGVSLFYNLGNAYYRTGKIGYAILYYEKAIRLAPGDEDIRHNLKIANARTVDKLVEFPSFFIFGLWEDILSFFSLSGWTYITYIYFVFLVMSAGGYLLFRNPEYQKYSFFTGILFAVLFLTSTAIMSVKLNRELNVIKGVVVEKISNVKSSPDVTGNDAFIIHEGLKVTLEDSVGDWIKVKLNDGKAGWIKENQIRII
jgi:hypothetical protein